MKWLQEIKSKEIGKVLENEDLRKYNTYKIGGKAKTVIFPFDVEKLIELMKIVEKYKLNYKILGNGSNVIFSDKLFDGIIIKLDNLNKLEINDNEIKVGAGYSLIKLAMKLSKLGYTGLEFAAGIPGSVGGSVFMNAGAYKSDMSAIVKEVIVLTPDFKVKKISNKDMNFKYRDSFLKQNKNYICLEVIMYLEKDDKNKILALIEDRRKRRVQSQPLEYPSAGSVFRNPDDNYAGKLIEDCDLKGKRIGGAIVSSKHANFIVNIDNASGADINDLIFYVKQKVKEKYNVDLKIEQEFINWE